MHTTANPPRPTRAPKAARPLRLAAAATLLGLALAACTGSGGGQPTTTTPSATTTTVSTTTTSPTPATTSSPTTSTAAPSTTKAIPPAVAGIPAAARANTDAGAEAFTRYFFSRLDKAYNPPDTDAVRGLYTSSCSVCRTLDQHAAELKAKSLHEEGGQYTLTNVTKTTFGSDGAQVYFTLSQTKLIKKDSSGQVIDTTTPPTGRAGVALKFADGNWAITKIGQAG